MHTEILTYEADGLTMQSHLFLPEGAGARPGVLVFPEAPGLGDNAKSRAERLAGLGYVALACDLHGQGRLYSDMGEMMAIVGKLRATPEPLRARSRGGLVALAARPEVDTGRIAAIGYCIGGTMALELARSGADIVGVVGFHSGLATTAVAQSTSFKPRVLVCIGADDPMINAAERAKFEDEMRTAKVEWRMHLYGNVVHSFTNPGADQAGMPQMARYDAGADARSWAEMQSFFHEVFA